ncbi:MAG: hypothetical protein Q8O64_18995 [Sideroxyarcus sp.]|nr:hypothetical protein [Sideroxyarcus sp.]
MAIRIKSRWFKEGRTRSPQELSDALAFTLWRIADNALKSTRQSNLDVEVGPQYFDFLAEFLIFLVLVADRIVYSELDANDRVVFTGNLANRVAETYAENRSRLLDGDLKSCKQDFIDLLNRRAGEYAEFTYGETGPDYHFYRYLAWCIGNVLTEEEAKWAIDPLITFEAPEAVQMVEKTLRGLNEAEPRPARRRAAAGAD